MKIKAYHKDLNSLHIGCEKPRAYYIPYHSEEAALAGERNKSAFLTNLCGEWNFRFYASYEDIEEDIRKHRYNPLIQQYHNPDFDEEIKMILTMMMSGCCKEFEKLPIIENVEILRNILYSGVWYRYEAVRQKREQKKSEGQDINHA